jgi:hypothetical protein
MENTMEKAKKSILEARLNPSQFKKSIAHEDDNDVVSSGIMHNERSTPVNMFYKELGEEMKKESMFELGKIFSQAFNK